jgi:hypothetical protein
LVVLGGYGAVDAGDGGAVDVRVSLGGDIEDVGLGMEARKERKGVGKGLSYSVMKEVRRRFMVRSPSWRCLIVGDMLVGQILQVLIFYCDSNPQDIYVPSPYLVSPYHPISHFL